MRRLRQSEKIRNLVAETRLHPDQFILPIFFDENIDKVKTTGSMPGVKTFPLSGYDKIASDIQDSGVNSVLVFGVPAHKDAVIILDLEDKYSIPVHDYNIQLSRLAIIFNADICEKIVAGPQNRFDCICSSGFPADTRLLISRCIEPLQCARTIFFFFLICLPCFPENECNRGYSSAK